MLQRWCRSIINVWTAFKTDHTVRKERKKRRESSALTGPMKFCCSPADRPPPAHQVTWAWNDTCWQGEDFPLSCSLRCFQSEIRAAAGARPVWFTALALSVLLRVLSDTRTAPTDPLLETWRAAAPINHHGRPNSHVIYDSKLVTLGSNLHCATIRSALQ